MAGKNNFGFYATMAVMALAAVGYFRWQAKVEEDTAVKTVTTYIQSNPIDAMVLQKHPNAFPKFYAHFRTAYNNNGGSAALDNAQIDMQQMIDNYYLVDYVWYTNEKDIRHYLLNEYNLIKTIYAKENPVDAEGKPVKAPKKQGGPVCDQYVKDSTLNYAKARTAAGPEVFDKYMKSSQQLFVGAKEKKLATYWPGIDQYNTILGMALMKVGATLATAYPDRDQLKAVLVDKPDTCQAYLIAAYGLLKQDDLGLSLVWRASLEKEREKIIEKRKKAGFE